MLLDLLHFFVNRAAFQVWIILLDFDALGVVAFVFFGGVARGRFAFLASFRAFERNHQTISLLCSHIIWYGKVTCLSLYLKNEAQIYGSPIEIPKFY
jgi:hypothetical protein